MRTLTITMIVTGAVIGGCGGGGGSDGGGPIVSPWYITYSNGHPIAASTSDGHVLAHENELFNLVNNHRASIAVPALINSESTRDVARAHSIHMAIGDFVGFVNPEGDDPGERSIKAGIGWTIYAENIEFGFHDARDVFENWLSSSGAHANIDDHDFVYAGVGYHSDSASIWDDYYTMDFRTP